MYTSYKDRKPCFQPKVFKSNINPNTNHQNLNLQFNIVSKCYIHYYNLESSGINSQHQIFDGQVAKGDNF